jgi:hypothetical protein
MGNVLLSEYALHRGEDDPMSWALTPCHL